jgi:hypothetical protein
LWKATYFPRRPLSFPRPPGKRVEVELRRMRFVFSAEAFTNTTRARYSTTACVFASITRTPVARPFASS